MANKEQLKLIKQGVDAWNKWREEHADTRPDLRGADLSGAKLRRVNLSGAKLIGADLYRASLVAVQLPQNLMGAKLIMADLSNAKLRSANLRGAHLMKANLMEADIKMADLSGADLTGASLIRTDFSGANLTGCSIFGVSAWGLKLDGATQLNLRITPPNESSITVDNLEIAQFIYLFLNNQKIRQVIETITSKVVLILGRFTEERKRVLDAIREKLRKHDYTSVLFDFDKPVSKDITGTVETLARMARFIIADLTDPSSIPFELGTIVPFLPTTPVLPIKMIGSQGFSMFQDLRRRYNWVLDIYEYADGDSLISTLPQVIAPADRMAEELRTAR